MLIVARLTLLIVKAKAMIEASHWSTHATERLRQVRVQNSRMTELLVPAEARERSLLAQALSHRAKQHDHGNAYEGRIGTIGCLPARARIGQQLAHALPYLRPAAAINAERVGPARYQQRALPPSLLPELAQDEGPSREQQI